MPSIEVGSYVRVGSRAPLWQVVRLDGGGAQARLAPSSLSLAGRGRQTVPVGELVIVDSRRPLFDDDEVF